MKIKKLEWTGDDKFAEAKIFEGKLQYTIDLKNRGYLRAPAESMIFESNGIEGYSDILAELTIGDDWTMEQCKGSCQVHFENMVREFIEDGSIEDADKDSNK